MWQLIGFNWRDGDEDNKEEHISLNVIFTLNWFKPMKYTFIFKAF